MQLEGQITDIRFQSEDTGYCVAGMMTEDGDIVITGTMPQLTVGASVQVEGELVFHPKYGEQFRVTGFSTVEPSSEGAIYAYLASGVIDKIGPKLAESIVDLFGKDTLRIMQEEPERLLSVRGIGKKTLKVIEASFSEQEESRAVMLFLQELGITPALASKIYKTYGDRTRSLIETNPYQLTDDVIGIGFKTADEIARGNRMKTDDPFRIRSGLQYVLQEAGRREGHCCLPEPLLLQRAKELLEVSEELLKEQLYTLRFERQLYWEKGNPPCFFSAEYYEAERDCAHFLARKTLVDAEELALEDAWIETLGEEQQTGIRGMIKNPVSILTGGPGTGKTTLLRALLRVLDENGQQASLCAPTGRAAKRMEESTGVPAATIHRLLGYNPAMFPSFEYDEDNPLDCDWIIVDEASMLDIQLLQNLLAAVREKTRLLFVGDVDQLPSVGPGHVLSDLIESGAIPTYKLTKIYRQAEESHIVLNAHRMQHGEPMLLNAKDKDFFFMQTRSPEESVRLIESLASLRLPKAYNTERKDIQILTPVKKGTTGTVTLNERLQESLNPYTPAKQKVQTRGQMLREGDRVIQMKNNYEMTVRLADGTQTQGVYNGDMGVITRIFDDEITVLFDDGSSCTYADRDKDDLALAYAITIHKSQGSEFPIVVLPLHKGPPMLYTRNLLYTAITRAKDRVILVGDPFIMRQMIANTHTQVRYTGLAQRLRAAEKKGRRGMR